MKPLHAITIAAFVLLTVGLAAAAAAPLGAAPLGAIDPPAPAVFAPETIERGANLAAIGNCGGCHTAPDRAPFSGGVAVPTPFGTVYGSNITPDPVAGIGAWSPAAFVRAMREGVARDGRELYPAFPYDHFTHATDQDLHALYAFVMTRTPVPLPSLSNRMTFPFGLRPLVAGWKLLFLRRGGVPEDPSRSAEWNRGAYLAQALAHCGACHTPRNLLGAERHGHDFEGGHAEGWYAPPLDARSPSPQPWSVDALTAYLRTGIAPGHAIAGGPMQGVTEALADADEVDVRAIAVYVISLMGTPDGARRTVAAASAERARRPLGAATAQAGSAPAAPDASAPPPGDDMLVSRDDEPALGARVYASACSSCHDAGRGDASNAALPLALAVALYDDDPRSLLHIVRDGIAPPDVRRGRWMPAFGDALSDAQLTALAAYLRRTAGAEAPWPELAKAVRETRAPTTHTAGTAVLRHDGAAASAPQKGP